MDAPTTPAVVPPDQLPVPQHPPQIELTAEELAKITHGAPVFPYLGIPSADDTLYFRTAAAAVNFCVDFGIEKTLPFGRQFEVSSLLCKNFNSLYSHALNGRKTHGVTHFFLLHNDVGPVPNDWGSRMLTIMQRDKLHALSAVISIRGNGLDSSTAWEADGKEPRRRVAIGEITGTVNSRDNRRLLINTGCLCIDLRHPAADSLYFAMKDGVRRRPDGIYEPFNESEDYNLSHMMRKAGMDFGATAEFEVLHCGRRDWSNLPAAKA